MGDCTQSFILEAFQKKYINQMHFVAGIQQKYENECQKRENHDMRGVGTMGARTVGEGAEEAVEEDDGEGPGERLDGEAAGGGAFPN